MAEIYQNDLLPAMTGSARLNFQLIELRIEFYVF